MKKFFEKWLNLNALKARSGHPPLREYKQPMAKHEASPLPGPVKSKLDKDGLRNIKIVPIHGNLNPFNILRKKSTQPRMKDNNREYSGEKYLLKKKIKNKKLYQS